MTTAAIEKKLKSVQIEVKNPLYARLMKFAPPRPITTKKDHTRYIAVIDTLQEILGDGLSKSNEKAIIRYLNVLAPLIAEFEDEEFDSGSASAREVLRYLMDANDLVQEDLEKELGGQSVASNILSGKRELNAGQIERLCTRFNVSASTFFPNSPR